ncbi:hypothetical protein Taro_012231 [Colocasia esculenta]|uniref:Uncharacterized protein n=1 Tax=Colocasia esculenta TaxID=4460 RepID=A0A843U892_COLES|nr:hypothetical protein [Colocasia esculenta]
MASQIPSQGKVPATFPGHGLSLLLINSIGHSLVAPIPQLSPSLSVRERERDRERGREGGKQGSLQAGACGQRTLLAMGSCVSSQKNKGAALAESLPALERPGPGSKDEAFFDSLECLESDCEDDFFSVNGDSTPSDGNSLDYQTGNPVRSQRSKLLSSGGHGDSGLETSPRKKLSELLQEPLRAKPLVNEHDIVDRVLEVKEKSEDVAAKTDHPPESSDGTPHLSGAQPTCGDVTTPDASSNNVKGKREKSKPCCLPSCAP